jgi:pyruvate,water dikinase
MAGSVEFMTDKWLFWLEELDQEYNEVAGKKSANLGEIIKAGLPAPHGFALTTDAYNRFIAEGGSKQKIKKYLSHLNIDPNNIAWTIQASKEIRQIIHSSTMPEDMIIDLESYYSMLSSRYRQIDLAVSVRSAGAKSRPGQYETYLNVKGINKLIKTIIEVWSSSFNDRSLVFRYQNSLPLDSDPIGIAVLKMVNARSAGVALTVNPNTGDTHTIIIEANWGLGESVVSGDITPDLYVLDKQSLEIREKKLGNKTHQVTVVENGVAKEEVPGFQQSNFCISDDEAREIGRLGRILEEHFGAAQDLEWAIDNDLVTGQNLFLLQTRPAIVSKRTSAMSILMDLFKEGN